MNMNVALLGHGTVGRGVVQIIESSVPSLQVTRILELPDRCTEPRMTSNFDDIANDSTIDCVVEAMGGLEPAHTYIVRALDAGKSVVTSNKAVVAAYFQEFVGHAKASGARLFIEATCGGGIPWIASIMKAKRIDEISSISGIMNGTTNYIIEKMRDDAVDFDVALSEAQRLGYAERDPTADIDGIDVKNKTIIGTSVAFGCACSKDIPTTGIRNLKIADLTFLESRGYVVKLLGRATQKDGRYAAAVEPVCMPLRTLEADVPSNFNLVTLVGTTIGELKFYGQGAGSLPTGNAIVQDLLDCSEGAKPVYRFDEPLTWDPSLLKGSYLLRTKAEPPEGAKPYLEGYWRLDGLNVESARALYEQQLEKDSAAFMAAFPQEA
ncbi:MAG: homoserine dehydrogenase [Atopobiaceae bacterium]